MKALGAAMSSAAASMTGRGQSRVEPEAGGSSPSRVQVIAGQGTQLATAAAGMAVDVGQAAAAKASQAAMEQSQKAANFVKELRALLNAWIKQKVMSVTERAVDYTPGFAKRVLEDPDMPRWVSRGKDRMIDASWPDVRAEILWELAVLLDRQEKVEPDGKGVDCIRAFFRYHWDPYDKTFWAKIRDPVYVLFQLIPCVPIYGVTPAWFFIVFLMIDKSEEFQLVKFILSFKGTAFLSMGVFRAILGFILYIGCVTAPANPSDHKCESAGPGASGEIWPTFFGFVFQVLLVWIAFALLRCSVEKGRSTIKGTVDVKEEGHMATKGGYIIYFLWYDLFAFCIAVAIIGFTFSTRPRFDMEDWPVHHAVFASQVVYGLLSMPFFLFTIPLLQRLLTHSLPSAYDRQGRARPLARPKPKEDEEAPRKPVPLFSEAELDELVSKVKKLMPSFMQNTVQSSAQSP